MATGMFDVIRISDGHVIKRVSEFPAQGRVQQPAGVPD